eukprot:189634-Chlamydomonas_euryale.AAC.1
MNPPSARPLRALSPLPGSCRRPRRLHTAAAAAGEPVVCVCVCARACVRARVCACVGGHAAGLVACTWRRCKWMGGWVVGTCVLAGSDCVQKSQSSGNRNCGRGVETVAPSPANSGSVCGGERRAAALVAMVVAEAVAVVCVWLVLSVCLVLDKPLGDSCAGCTRSGTRDAASRQLQPAAPRALPVCCVPCARLSMCMHARVGMWACGARRCMHVCACVCMDAYARVREQALGGKVKCDTVRVKGRGTGRGAMAAVGEAVGCVLHSTAPNRVRD